MKHPRPAPNGPFSKFLSVEELSHLPGQTITLTASPAECAALAAVNGLEAISRLEAVLRVVCGSREIHVTGEVKARVTQTCVVTLEPFEADVREEIDIRFAEPVPPVAAGRGSGVGQSKGKAKDKDLPRLADLAEEGLDSDPPETIIDGHVDLAAVVAEFFALGLDPYPRKPGAAFESEDVAFDGDAPQGKPLAEEKPESPFAALARLRKPE